MKTILGSHEGLTSYSIAGRKCENIHLFDSTGIVYSTGYGYFTARKEANIFNPQEVKAVMIEEPKRKTKIDFTYENPFWVSGKAGVELYIPAFQVDFVPKGEVTYMTHDTHTSFMDAFEITLHCSFTNNVEEIKRRVISVFPERVTRTEKTALGIDIDQLEATFKKLRIVEGYFNYATFLQHFKVTPKQ